MHSAGGAEIKVSRMRNQGVDTYGEPKPLLSQGYDFSLGSHGFGRRIVYGGNT